MDQVANKLIQSGHYASDNIASLSSHLNRCWKEFATSLDERTSILSHTFSFYTLAERYLRNVNNWTKQYENISSSFFSIDAIKLEETVHSHQTLFESILKDYDEIYNSSKKLCCQLNRFINFCYSSKLISPSSSVIITSSTPSTTSSLPNTSISSSSASSSRASRTPSTDYNEASKLVISVTHEVMSKHKELESLWSIKKTKLHQRLALALFQDDVRQVIDWIDTHGQGFLKQYTGIGKNLQTARALQKKHETFEEIAKNTYTNVEKLLHAADEFSRTGECNPQDIFNIKKELKSHLNSFVESIEKRRRHLHLGVLFFTHEKELSSWFEELQDYHRETEVPIEAPETVEACLNGLEEIESQKDFMIDTVLNTIREGESLIQELQSIDENESLYESTSSNHSGSSSVTSSSTIASSVAAIVSFVNKFKEMQNEMKELWEGKKLKMELCRQLRLFEKDVVNIINKFELSKDEISRNYSNELRFDDINLAERALQEHNESFSRVQQIAFDVLQRGQDLEQVM